MIGIKIRYLVYTLILNIYKISYLGKFGAGAVGVLHKHQAGGSHAACHLRCADAAKD